MIWYRIWLGLSAFLITGTWLPFSDSDWWFVRAFDFPRVQLLILVVLAFIWGIWKFDAGALRHALLVLLGASALFLVSRIAPYTPLYPKELKAATDDAAERRLRLYSVNVLQDNRDYGATLAQIREQDPDVAVLLETDAAWIAAVRELRERYPYYREVPLPNYYGLAVYSRLPWRRPRVYELVDDSIPSLYATLELPSRDSVNLYVIHPTPPSPTENPKSTERDAELLMVADSVRQQTAPSIVLGDLNDVAWSPSSRLFKRTSGLLDPRVGRGTFNTFATGNWLLRWPLDYIFPSNEFTVHRLQRLPDVGSDHFPIVADLQYQPEMRPEQEKSRPRGDDLQEAAEEKAKVGK